MFYQRPSVRKGKITHRPSLTHNPNGLTKKHQSWNDIVAQAYADLRVENNERMNVYLVAFLSCWLCVFVFPSGDLEFPRPETFKIVNIMVVRHKVVGPWMIDFFGKGGAKPFDENFARKLIHTNI